MQKRYNYLLNISVLVLLLCTLFAPFLSTNKYYDLIISMKMDVTFFSDLHMLIYIGLFIVTTISIIINYNILKVICKAVGLHIENKIILIIYLVVSLLLTSLNFFMDISGLNINRIILKTIITTILYLVFLFLYCSHNKEDFKKGVTIAVVFNVVNMLIEFFTLFGIS